MITVIIFVTIVTSAIAAPAESDDWTIFKKLYKKVYATELEEKRKKVFFYENQQTIKLHNEMYDLGLYSYKIKMNQFGDMSSDEYQKYMHLSGKPMKLERILSYDLFVQDPNIEIPNSIDWRKKGAVTAVRDQGLNCGSCYAFSATGALEAQYFKKTGILMPLSVQYLIDCTEAYAGLSCDGGSAAGSFQFVVDQKGLAPEANYTYEGRQKECPYLRNDFDSKNPNKSYVYIRFQDEDALKEAVATVGPVSVAIDGSHDTFRFYSEGIYFQPFCHTDDLNHAVLIVGYGTDNSTSDSFNRDYWLVKNSWGETWGESGYFKIARHRQNHCGIASVPIFPLV